MRTNIEIDDDLMVEAMKATGARTKREAVQKSLERTVRAARQRQAWNDLRGTGWDGDLDDMRTSKYVPAE